MKDGVPIKVAIFEPFGNMFGSERSMLDLLGALSPKDVMPVVYCPKRALWLPELRRLKVRYYDWFASGLHERSRLHRAVALGKFALFLLLERIEVIHVNQAGAAPYALAAGRWLGLPVVLHSRWHEDGESINSWKKNIDALSKIVCISEFQKKLVGGQLRNGQDKLVVVLNPYRMGTDRALSTAHAEDIPRFVCPARLHPHKRQDLLVRATQAYVEKYGPCLVQFIGEEVQGSGYLETLKSLARELGIEQHVLFSGHSSNVVQQLQKATAMVLPSDVEALGRVVFEAWDAGTVPIAWQASGGPSETISQAEAGILYSAQTPQVLAAAMFEVASLDTRRRDRLVSNGLNWVNENCSPQMHARSILNIWRNELASRA